MALSLAEYCEHYAQKCLLCHGQKRVLDNRIWISCKCQETATLKWRLEQIQVTPSSLKYKDWEDFTGAVGESSITNSLTPDSLIASKSKAMEYCFGEAGINGPKSRLKTSVMKQRLAEGKNFIIAGNHGSGKSLLACLISKEAIRFDIPVKWISFSELCIKARWSADKSIEYTVLDDWADIPFLVIDGIELARGYYGDLFTLNNFFRARNKNDFITLFLCSRRVLNCVRQTPQLIEDQLGKEFLALMTDQNNTVIELVLQDESNG
jgi:hypothetical protein